MRDLPIPGSPETSTTCPSPALARAQRRNSRSISSARPISGLSADPRNASNRLAKTLGRSTCQAGTGVAMPLTSTPPRSRYSKKIADQPARARGDDDSIRLGQGLQPGGEVRRLTDDRLFLRRSFADQIADDHQPGGDPDACLELDGFDIEATDSVDRAQSRPDRPLGVVLMRLWVAEIDQYAVAHVPGDEAVEPGDNFGDSAVIRGDHVTQILGIEACGQRGRADQIAEHHGQLPAFGDGGIGDLPTFDPQFRLTLTAQCGDRSKQLAPVPDEAHAEILEVVGSQLRQYRGVNRVVAKRLFVSL
jgi:hypothetical protein